MLTLTQSGDTKEIIFIFPDESIRMENQEEAETVGDEIAADTHHFNCDSHLMAATIMTRVIIIIIYHIKYHYNHICIISNIINDDESHQKVNRTEFLSELEGGRVILQGDDPHVQWQ